MFVGPKQWSWPLNLPVSFFGIFATGVLMDGETYPWSDELDHKVFATSFGACTGSPTCVCPGHNSDATGHAAAGRRHLCPLCDGRHWALLRGCFLSQKVAHAAHHGLRHQVGRSLGTADDRAALACMQTSCFA